MRGFIGNTVRIFSARRQCDWSFIYVLNCSSSNEVLYITVLVELSNLAFPTFYPLCCRNLSSYYHCKYNIFPDLSIDSSVHFIVSNLSFLDTSFIHVVIGKIEKKRDETHNLLVYRSNSRISLYEKYKLITQLPWSPGNSNDI